MWYDDLVDHVITTIDTMPWGMVLGERYQKPIGRAKTIQTLRDKLLRMPSHHLPTIQDLAGVRMEWDMTLDEQDKVAEAICNLFKQNPTEAIDDLREGEHAGYRAVHVRLSLPYPNARVEVQIRTKLQGVWANLYEELADVVGREIRYETLPESDWRYEMVSNLQQGSLQAIAEVEVAKNLIARLEAIGNSKKRPAGVTKAAAVQIRKALTDTAHDREAQMQRLHELEKDLVRDVDEVKAALRQTADELRVAASNASEESK